MIGKYLVSEREKTVYSWHRIDADVKKAWAAYYPAKRHQRINA